MVLALNSGLAQGGTHSRLLTVRNYRMSEQPLHALAVAQGQDAAELPCRGRLDMTTVRTLKRHIAATGAAVVHVHDYKSAFYAWLATRGSRVTRIATLHGWVGATASLRLYNRMEMSLLRRFDALVVVSDAQRPILLRNGVATSLVHQIDNGIAVPVSPPQRDAAVRAELGLAPQQFVLAAVARLSSEKNLTQLLDSVARVGCDQDIVLVVAGDGPERAALEKQATALGIAHRVRFLGQRDDMAQLWPAFDALVLPSLTEGMPLVVLEAMAHGIPVIASRVGDVPRMLGHSPLSTLIDPGDGEALDVAIRRHAVRGTQVDTAAHRHVLAHHSIATMSQRYQALYLALQEARHDRRTA